MIALIAAEDRGDKALSDKALIDQYLNLYANNDTAAIADDARRAVDVLFAEARAAGLEQVFQGVPLWRSDGTPTFHLASVVDDIDFRISDVIRGSDHRPNEQLHADLHRAAGRDSLCGQPRAASPAGHGRLAHRAGAGRVRRDLSAGG